MSHEQRIKLEKIALGLFLLGVFAAVPFIATNFGPSGMVTYGPGGCVVPEEDLLVTFSMTLCNGTYYLNDTNTNGAIRIYTNDITLNCDNTIIEGSDDSNSVGISIDANSAKINGCTISNFKNGITGYNINHSTLTNNILTNNADNAILFTNSNNNTINYNNISGGATGSLTRGIDFYGVGGNHIIEGNIVDTYKYGITLRETNPDSEIKSNTVSNQGLWGISASDNSNNTLIESNTIINSSWNNIHFNTWNNRIISNTIINFLHHGIDTHSDLNETLSGNNLIANNIITKDSSDYSSGDSGIYIGSSTENIIENNTIENLTFDQESGIAMENGDFTTNNVIRNNIFRNVSKYCLYDNSMNTNWSYNELYDCGNHIRVFGAWNFDDNITKSTFKYNYVENENLTFVATGDRVNVTIIENKSMRINVTGSSGNRVFNTYLQIPYNDIYNLTVPAYLYNNSENETLILEPGQQVLIDDLVLDPNLPNNPPLTPSPTLSTENATNLAEQDLDCEATITDPDNNPLNVTVKWFRDGLNTTVDYNNSYSSGTSFTATLDKSYTNIGDTWLCKITLNDGENISQEGVSNSFIITDTSGVQYDTYQNNNSNPYVNDSVNFSLHVFSDNELDSYTLEINNETNITNNINSNDATISEIVNISEEGITCIKFFINNTVNKTNQTDYSCITSTIYVEPSNILYSNLAMTPSSVDTGDQVTISVDVTNNKILEEYTLYDNFSGIWTQTTNEINQTNTSISITKSTIEGNNCAWFEFRDINNETNETSILCATATEPAQESSGGGGGGGGGGGLSATATVEENVIEEVTQIQKKESKVLIVDVKNETTEKITVNLKKLSLGKNIKVSTIKKPKEVPEPEAEVYEYIKVTHEEIPDEDITSVTKSFKVKKEWIKNNNLNKEEIKLFRYTTKWTALPTKIIKEDDTYVHYEAESPGLSIFAIGVENKIIEPVEELTTEQPKQIDPVESKRPYFAVITLLLIGFLIGIMIWVKQDYKPVKLNKTQEQVTKYVEDALNAGYHKLAIRHILKRKGVQENLIKFAFKQLKTTKSTIRHKKPVNAHLSPETFENIVNQLIPYIKKEREEGYYLHEIEEALIHYGHDHKTIKEAIKRIKNE